MGDISIWAVVGIGVLALVGGYVVRNGMRNGDPLNRKCAAEICEYLVSGVYPQANEVAAIFMGNARYRKQAIHIVSMVPALLISAGIPRDRAISFVGLLTAAAEQIPE